jgi:PAS domain S-box-containing protein
VTGAYVYTSAIWLPLAAVVFLVVIGLCAWQHRDVPGGKPFLAMSVITVPILLSMALEAAAVAPETKLAHQKLQFILIIVVLTPVACMALDYAFPGRWQTRRNLVLLSVPLTLTLLLVVIDDGRLIWRQPEVNASGEVVLRFAPAGAILVAYGIGVGVLLAVVFIHVFIRSPQHRWPVVVMVLGQMVTRVVFLLDTAHLPAFSSFNLTLIVVLLPWTAYAIALFGFRILDPLPAARQAVLDQMHAGVAVFDANWRVFSLNPAAETILGVRTGLARGKTWQQIGPPEQPLPDLPDFETRGAGAEDELPDMTFGTGAAARQYAPSPSTLTDFRGLPVGHLLMLRDVTEQRRAEAETLERQRLRATLRERERLARELHDSIGQVFGFANLKVGAARQLMADGRLAKADDQLATVERIVAVAHADLREYILNLRIGPSDERSFLGALRQYLDGYRQNYGIWVELSPAAGMDDGVLSVDAQLQLFRILQEALSNARKHARTDCVWVSFEKTAGPAVRMRIRDNGQGFDPLKPAGDGSAQAPGGHLGLGFMRERAEQLGGVLRIESAPGQGTCVEVEVPACGS